MQTLNSCARMSAAAAVLAARLRDTERMGLPMPPHSITICSVIDCERPRHAKGLCLNVHDRFMDYRHPDHTAIEGARR
jgi:hypothetical protein